MGLVISDLVISQFRTSCVRPHGALDFRPFAFFIMDFRPCDFSISHFQYEAPWGVGFPTFHFSIGHFPMSLDF
jgi:hypothetical protein